MSEYRKDFDETKCMSFLMKLFEKYSKIWRKFKNAINKELDSDPV